MLAGGEFPAHMEYLRANLTSDGTKLWGEKGELAMRIRNSFSLALTVFLIAFSIGCAEMRKGPYLIPTGDNTQMTINWQLSQTQTCLLEWGDDEGYSLGSTHTDENGSAFNQHQHSYTVIGLAPGSKYYYRVTTSTAEYTGTFWTAPSSAETSLKFMAYGDTRTHPDIHDLLAEAMVSTHQIDEGFQTFILGVGDLVSDGDMELMWDIEFFDPKYENIQTMLANVPLVSCMGNHEQSGALYEKYFPYPFEAGGRYWSFDYGPAHFTMVDQYVVYGLGSSQLEWIENDLSSTDRAWKFMFLHEPGWSAGGHSNEEDVQNYIQPLCEEYGVDMVFAGHNHYYARAVVNDVYHVTTGGGGAPLYAPDPDYTPEVVATSESNHFCRVEIEGNALIFTAEKPDGAEIDTFSIYK